MQFTPSMSEPGPTEPLNPYEAPRAELEQVAPPTTDLSPSLLDAIAGRYNFTIGAVMDEAWELVKGMKASFWGAAVVIGVIYLAFDMIVGLIFAQFLSAPPGPYVKQVIRGLVGALTTPVTMGLQMMCVRRALGLPISSGTAFNYFSRSGTALLAALLVFVATYVGTLALVIPGIYLGVAYRLVTQLVCDQGLTASQALSASRRAIAHRWWSVLGLGVAVVFSVCLSALGLLIPLIWTIPWSLMTTAVLYRRIFYESAPPPARATTT